MSGASPLPRHPRILFSISSIVTVDWCCISAPPPPPSSRQTHRRAKQFLHLHAWGDTVSFKHTWTLEKMHGAAAAAAPAAFRAWIHARGEPLRPSTTCNQCQDHAGEIQNALIQWLSLSHLTAGHCFLQENDVAVRGKIAIFSFYGDRWLDLYSASLCIYHTQERGGCASSEYYAIYSQVCVGPLLQKCEGA